MRQHGKVISYSTNEGKQWAFVIVPENMLDLYEQHTRDEQLQITKKGSDLRVQFTDAATQEKTTLGMIVTTKDTKFTDDEIAEICKEHGLINAVQGLQQNDPAPATPPGNKAENGSPDPA